MVIWPERIFCDLIELWLSHNGRRRFQWHPDTASHHGGAAARPSDAVAATAGRLAWQLVATWASVCSAPWRSLGAAGESRLHAWQVGGAAAGVDQHPVVLEAVSRRCVCVCVCVCMSDCYSLTCFTIICVLSF